MRFSVSYGSESKSGMERIELKPSKIYELSYMVDYEQGSAVVQPIMTKNTGSVQVCSLDSGELLDAKVLPFDILFQVIEGAAEVLLSGESTELKSGQIMIIPAHCKHQIKANERFKMLSTVIKSGYETVSI